jgi:hypothetical protein
MVVMSELVVLPISLIEDIGEGQVALAFNMQLDAI